MFAFLTNIGVFEEHNHSIMVGIHDPNEILIVAVEDGDLELVKSALEKGADIISENVMSGRAITGAAQDGHLEIMKYLREKGADIHVWNDAPFRCAASKGHVQVVEYLLNTGTYRDDIKDVALQEASINGYLEVVHLLVVNDGVDVNARNKKDGGAVAGAALNGHIQVVEFLLNHGADVHACEVDAIRQTPHIHVHSEILKLLLDYGLNIFL